MKSLFSLLPLLAFAFFSCSGGLGSSESRLAECADSFAVHYFNYHFADAMRFVTPESEKWLHYAASNVHQADIDLLRSQEEPATVELNEIEIDEADSTGTIRLSVSNFLRMDTIGTSAHLTKRATYVLHAVCKDKKWRIRMAGLPRSGKRSRD
jgi:hypothetical protein